MDSKKNKYLIIGSNSFSGSNLINYLLNKKSHVIGVSRSYQYDKNFLKYSDNKFLKNYKFFKMDINRDLKKILELIAEFKPKYIINFAAQGDVRTSWIYPDQWYKTNFISLSNLSNKLIGNKYLKKFLSVSTPEVYGSTKNNIVETNSYDPSTPYALSKLSADLHLQLLKKKYDFPVLFSRSVNVYGSHQLLYRIIPRTIIYAKFNKKLTLHGNGNSKRSFIHIDDVVSAYNDILEKGKIGEAYHISSSEGLISIYNLVKQICDVIGHDFNSFIELTDENFGQDFSYSLNSSKLRNLRNWNDKVKLIDGIVKTNKWIEKNWLQLKLSPLNYKHKK